MFSLARKAFRDLAVGAALAARLDVAIVPAGSARILAPGRLGAVSARDVPKDVAYGEIAPSPGAMSGNRDHAAQQHVAGPVPWIAGIGPLA